LLVQGAGRAGRGDLAGEVVVQTFTPHAMPIQFGRQAEVDGFLGEEIASRRAHGYPPFRHLVLQVFRGPNAEKVAFFAEHWAKRVTDAAGDLAEVRGPTPCAIEKIKDQYRYQIWYFTRQVTKLNARLADLQKDFPLPDDVHATLDVDPMSVA